MRRVTAALTLAAIATGLTVAACSDAIAPADVSNPITLTSAPPVASVRILPDTEDIRVGETIRLTLQLRDAAGALLTGRLVEWGSTEPAAATIDATGLITGVAAGRTRIFARSEGKADTSFLLVTGPAGPPVWYISLSPDTIRLAVGDSLRTTLQLRDHRGNPLTGRVVTRRSLAPGVAQIDTTGLVTAVGVGLAQILAASEGLADTSTVIVGSPPVVAVRVQPDSASVFVGGTIRLTAAVTDGAGTPLAGRRIAWSSLDPTVAAVDSTGLVGGLAPGQARIVAASGGVADTAHVAVSLAPVATMTIYPDSATILVGRTIQLTGTPRDAAGNMLAGRTVTWRTLQPSVATVDAAGRATGVAPGQAVIVVESEGRADSARIAVVPVPVASVVVQPDTATLLVAASRRLTATPRDSAGNPLAGRAVQWSSLQSTIARVDSGGLVTAVTAGLARIVATSEGRADTATITVVPPPVASVRIAPDSATIDVGQSVQLAATTHDAGGAQLPGRAVTWRTLHPTLATVASNGSVTGVSAGSAAIVATSEGVADTARVTVRAPASPSQTPVARVSLQPDFVAVAEGDTTRLVLRLRDANFNTLSVTGRVVAWSSMAPSTARVDSTGLITGVVAGQAGIVATVEGVADTSFITVNPATTTPPPPPPPPPSSTGPAGDPSQLPIAARQLPDYARYPGRTIAAGQSYADPATGARVWRVTDPSTPVANSQAYHDYSAGPVQISRDWGGERHTLLVMSGGYHLVDFTRGQGLSNWRRAPAANGDLTFTFAQNPATPRIAYFLSGRVLHRYNTQTMQLENTGYFPKDFSSVASGSLGWLQQDHSDGWFVMMVNGTSRVIAWNSQTNQTRTIDVPNLDEPHLEKDGRYVVLLTGGGTAPIWDLSTGGTRVLNAETPHLEAVRSYFVSWFPSWTSGPQYYANAATGQVTITLEAKDLSPDNMHRAGQWVQSDAQLPGGSLLKQWFLWSGFGDGIVTPGGWTNHAGQVYWTTAGWSPLYQKPMIGVRSVRQYVPGDPTRIARQLTQASSIATMTEGSFYYDAATTRVYVWIQGGGSPAGQVEMRAPGTIHDGIGFVRVDGSEVRLLAHTYQLYRSGQYWQLPRATVSPDGKVVLFDSNMNDADGRADVFLVEVPAR